MSFRYLKGPFIKILLTHILYDCTVLIYRTWHENDKKTSCLEGIRKGYHFSMEGIGKGYLFCQKWYVKG